MKEIKLTKGKLVILDDDDHLVFSKFKWSINAYGYIMRRPSKSTELIWLHREITNCPSDKVVDHIDGNPLNNQKSNLRICTRAENQRNQKVQQRLTKTSKFKGVHLEKHLNKFRARITLNNKHIHLGLFETEELAAKAYNKAAIEYFGKFAKLNNL